MLEETRNKFVIINNKDIFLFEGALPSSLARGEGCLHVPCPWVVVILLPGLLLVRHLDLLNFEGLKSSRPARTTQLSSTSLLHYPQSTEPRRSSAPPPPRPSITCQANCQGIFHYTSFFFSASVTFPLFLFYLPPFSRGLLGKLVCFL